MVLDTQSQNIAKYRRLNAEATRISNYGDISAVSGSKILDPVEQLLRISKPNLSIMTEAVIFWMQTRYGLDVFIEAQREFQDLTGRVFHDDYFYHQRMSYFLDYFTYQRPFEVDTTHADGACTPYELFMGSDFLDVISASDLIKEAFAELKNFRHSLLQVVKIAKNRMSLRDLNAKERFDIHSDGEIVFEGFTVGSVLQGFLFVIDGRAHLSQGVLIHPVAVARLIRKALKPKKHEAGIDLAAVLARLAKQNMALVRHRNLDAKKIYSQLPR